MAPQIHEITPILLIWAFKTPFETYPLLAVSLKALTPTAPLTFHNHALNMLITTGRSCAPTLRPPHVYTFSVL